MQTVYEFMLRTFMPILLATAVFGCGPAEGPDALSNRHASAPPSGCTTACHSAAGSISPNPLITNGSGADGKHIIHVSGRGIFCDKCHLNYENEASHFDSSLDTGSATIPLVRFDNVNPSGSWTVAAGTCSALACHGPDTVDWYGTTPWIRPACSACHSTATATRRQIQGPNGDFGANAAIISRHVSNVGDPASAQCEVCHELSMHTSGSILVKNADAGVSIPYDPSNPSSLEPFCLSCHDSDGATSTFLASGSGAPLNPFDDGRTLGTAPNIAGIYIKDSWEKQYGHRRKGLTCLGNGLPGTGCHGNFNTLTSTGAVNGHGSGNVGLLSNKYELPILSTTWNEARYTLCVDCHSSYPAFPTMTELFGVAAGGNYAQPQANYGQWPYSISFMLTGFHDYYSYSMDRQFNLHLYHLIEGMGGWSYRGVDESISSCVTCHNVHGVDNMHHNLWDEWNFSIENISGVEYGRVNKTDIGGDFGCIWGVFCGPSIPTSTPIYPELCAVNCHWDGTFRYPRSPFNEAQAVAYNTSGGVGLANGDSVAIYFSDSTNGPAITEANIDSVLALSGPHSWIDSNKGGSPGTLTAAWSSVNGKTNNVLTITIFIANSGAGDPTIAVGDTITFDLTTIMDANGTAVRGKMTLTGSF